MPWLDPQDEDQLSAIEARSANGLDAEDTAWIIDRLNQVLAELAVATSQDCAGEGEDSLRTPASKEPRNRNTGTCS